MLGVNFCCYNSFYSGIFFFFLTHTTNCKTWQVDKCDFMFVRPWPCTSLDSELNNFKGSNLFSRIVFFFFLVLEFVLRSRGRFRDSCSSSTFPHSTNCSGLAQNVRQDEENKCDSLNILICHSFLPFVMLARWTCTTDWLSSSATSRLTTISPLGCCCTRSGRRNTTAKMDRISRCANWKHMQNDNGKSLSYSLDKSTKFSLLDPSTPATNWRHPEL